MSEPLESELAGGRHPEASGDLHLGQAAAAPTYGELQVPSKDPLINFEFEAGGGEAPQPPAPSGSQAAPTVTTSGVVGVHLQNMVLIDCHRRAHYWQAGSDTSGPRHSASTPLLLNCTRYHLP
jgi:hypothetical protein